jgi:rhodanese-related sulfurtransferase
MTRSPRSSLQVVAIALWLAALVSCSPGAPKSSISQSELASRIATRAAPLVIDVRTRVEFDSGHVPGAVHVPHGEVSTRLRELGTGSEREIVVYCEQGNRSALAAAALRRAGFRAVLHLEGDWSAWRASGLPCEGC